MWRPRLPREVPVPGTSHLGSYLKVRRYLKVEYREYYVLVLCVSQSSGTNRHLPDAHFLEIHWCILGTCKW